MISLLRPGALKRMSNIWTITRRDGTVHRFTDHSRPIELVDVTYEPFSETVTTYLPKGIRASARTKYDQLQDQDVEFRGGYDQEPTANSITFEDIRAKRFRLATIDEKLIDWRYPWAGVFDSQRFYVIQVDYSQEEFVLYCGGLTTFLKGIKTLTYSLTCRFSLGDVDCGVDITTTDFSHSDTVLSVQDDRNAFTGTSPSASHGDNFYKFGHLEWLTGDNTQEAFDVRSNVQSSGAIVLYQDTPRPIQAGDTYIIYAGCNGTLNHCENKFANFTPSGVGLKIGATPYMPGPHLLHNLNPGIGGFNIPPPNQPHPALLDPETPFGDTREDRVLLFDQIFTGGTFPETVADTIDFGDTVIDVVPPP